MYSVDKMKMEALKCRKTCNDPAIDANNISSIFHTFVNHFTDIFLNQLSKTDKRVTREILLRNQRYPMSCE